MKENPIDSRLRHDMKEGALVKEGFLGDDARPLAEIVEGDEAELQAAGLSAAQLAEAMRSLTKKGMENMGLPIQVDGYTVTVEEYMGRMGCPFKHAAREAKRNTRAINAQGKLMDWTDMSIHLIEAHGFFQGVGSAYRLEPLELAEFLGLLKK